MSYSVFLQRFLYGDAVSFDARTVEQALAPYVTVQQESFVELAFADGGDADVYYSPADGTLHSVMFTHFSPGEALELMALLAARVDAVVLLQEGIALLTEPAQHQHLPEELRDGAVLIGSGADIQAVLDTV